MNRGWFEEKIADKLLFGVLVTCLTGLAFAQYEAVGESIAYAQKNVDTYVTYQKENLDRVVSGINGTVTKLYEWKSGSADALQLKIAAIQDETAVRSALPAFSNKVIGGGAADVTTIVEGCLATYSKSLQADIVDDLEKEAAQSIIDELVGCRERLVPAFSEYLGRVVDQAFRTAIDSKSVGFGFFRASWQTVFLILLLLATSATVLVWYLRSPPGSG